MSAITLSDDERDMIAWALRQVYLFDGPGSCPDYDAASALVERLGES